MTTSYDVIVVGARCAGSPTAMLLARMGQRVLLVDKASFPSDTISTHLVHAPGMAALARWGLHDQLVASGCPPIRTYSYDFGPFTVSGSPRPTDSGIDVAYGPRRTVLDKILLDGAVEAGAEVRENFHVQDVVVENGRVVGIRGRASGASSAPVEERASLVIGADGRHSVIADAVGAPTYHERPAGAVAYYAYWSDLPVDEFDVHLRPGRAISGMPTHDGLNCLVVAIPRAEMPAFRGDIETNYLKALQLVPDYADRIGAATRESRYVGMAVPNFYRQPYGPGWALVGDAGYERDPCTAQGISDAFRDAELLATAWHDVRTERMGYAEAMADYQRTRDEQTGPIYDLTCQMATLDPPPAEQAQLLGAMAGNQEAMNGFVSMIAGTLPVTEFFSEANVQRILSEAEQPATRPA